MIGIMTIIIKITRCNEIEDIDIKYNDNKYNGAMFNDTKY